MLEIIGVVLLAIWMAKKAKTSGKAPITWGLIAVGIYVVSYVVIYMVVTWFFQQVIDRSNDLAVANAIFSVGLIVICFSISASLSMKFLKSRT